MRIDGSRKRCLFPGQSLGLSPFIVFEQRHRPRHGFALRGQAAHLLDHVCSLDRGLLLALRERCDAIAHALDGRLLRVNRVVRCEARSLRGFDHAGDDLDFLPHGIDSDLAIVEIRLRALEGPG